MTDKKISQTAAADPLTGTEAIPIVQAGLNKRTTPAEVLTYIEDNITGGSVAALNDLTDAKTNYTGGDGTVQLGNENGDNITSGVSNVSVGQAHKNLSTGSDNTAVGAYTQNALISGSDNTSVGSRSLNGIATGSGNTVVGKSAGSFINNTDDNTCVGSFAGVNTVGSKNTYLGVGAGASSSTGNENTIVGWGADTADGTMSNVIAIGNLATAQASNTAQIGNAAITDVTFGDASAILHADGSALSNLPTPSIAIDDLTDALTTADSIFLGDGIYDSLTTGERNTVVGQSAATDLSSGSYNTIIGFGAGGTVATSIENTLIGAGADIQDDSTVNAIAIGKNAQAVSSNTVQIGNFFITDVTFGNADAILHADGSALSNLPTPSLAVNDLTDAIANYTENSIYIGMDAGTSASGFGNVGFGRYALTSLGTGGENAAFGYQALQSLSSGSGNIGIGRNTGGSVSTGSDNTIIGKSADLADGTFNNATALGHDAIAPASDTVQLGNGSITDVWCGDGSAILHADGSALSNLPTPTVSIDDLTDGVNNGSNLRLGIVTGALTGAENTSVGNYALYIANSGNNNTAVGFGTLGTATGDRNTGVGEQALRISGGDENVAVGNDSLWNLSTGNRNVCIGSAVYSGVGGVLETGSDNTLLGYGVDVSAAGAVNQIVIGSGAVGVADNTVQLGNTSITDVWCGDGTAILHADGSALTDLPNQPQYAIAESNIAPTGSPFTYQNTSGYSIDVIVSGGTVSLIEFSRDGATYYSTGLIAGIVNLSPGDYIKVTYTLAPTMTKVPR